MTLPTGQFLVKRFEQALERFNGAYADPYADAEDRADAKRNLTAARNLLLAGIPEWLPIETAPIDERILIAATPDWVIEGLVLPDSETAMGEPVTRRTYHHADGDTFHPNLVPTHWMPLPKHPEVK